MFPESLPEDILAALRKEMDLEPAIGERPKPEGTRGAPVGATPESESRAKGRVTTASAGQRRRRICA